MLPEIEVTQNKSSKVWKLVIDGVHHWLRSDKISIKRYLKRTYNIDLLTDPRIKKNYVEFQHKKIAERNGLSLIIKKQRNESKRIYWL